jgi:predicted DNA-binding helix-hairpin-helix protein
VEEQLSGIQEGLYQADSLLWSFADSNQEISNQMGKRKENLLALKFHWDFYKFLLFGLNFINIYYLEFYI